MDNYVSGLENFLKVWDDIVAYNSASDNGQSFVKGENGAINADGQLSCFEASIFALHSPSFDQSIEEGVRELVLFVVHQMNCITYTSCEGHFDKSQEDYLQLRHVGIIPRNQKEYEFIKQTFQEASSSIKSHNISLEIDETYVQSESIHMPCIDIWFVPVGGKEELYFFNLDKIYREFLEQLSLLI